MNKLIIDTTDNRTTTIRLEFDDKVDEVTKVAPPRTQVALVLISEILKKNNLSPKNLDEIEVNTGPGSFTGTRVGVAIANALGFSAGVKVNGKIAVEPKYD